jgi:spermidine/putrescine transport system ATP-binding protein
MNSGGSNAVEAVHVGKVFFGATGDFRALDDVSVAIGKNEFFTLLGPSGCGKTTLLRLIAGFEHPTEGHILLEGDDISDLPPFKRPVNTVFQNYALFPHMTVADNIGFGLKMLKKSKSEIADTVTQMLRLVRMEELRDRKTAQISGGQQQRVALARALAPKPKVLLLDEPLSALDYQLRKEMQIELKRMQTETGITFIFVTHDQEEALTMSDRIAVMNAGRILQIGTPREIYDTPSEKFVATFIGESNFLDGVVETHLGSPTNGVFNIRVGSGAKLTASGSPDLRAGDRITVAIRPEHALVTSAGGNESLDGVVDNVVYFGTDTHYHLTLGGGEPFIVRRQNQPGGVGELHRGDNVSVRISSAQIVRA